MVFLRLAFFAVAAASLLSLSHCLPMDPASSHSGLSQASASGAVPPAFVVDGFTLPELAPLQEDRPDKYEWHFSFLNDEMRRWRQEPFPALRFTPHYAVQQLPARSSAALRLDLINRMHERSLLYVGSRVLLPHALCDFYVTPVAMRPASEEIRAATDEATRGFLGWDSPSMVLISAPANQKRDKPMMLGLHGFAKFDPMELGVVQREIGKARKSRSLFEILTRTDPKLFLPIVDRGH